MSRTSLFECKHRHITNVGLTVLAHASLPIKYWGEAFTTAVNIINVLPSSVINFDTLYHLFFKKQSDYNFYKNLWLCMLSSH